MGQSRKGIPNRKLWAARAKCELHQVDPLEFLLLVIKGDAKALGVDEVPLDMRVQAANNAASYCYPKLKSMELNINHEQQETLDYIEQLKSLPEPKLVELVEEKIKEIKNTA